MTAGSLSWRHLPLEVAREVAAVLALQVLSAPVAGGDDAAARGGLALTAHRLRVAAKHRVVDRQLLAGADVSHRDEQDLTLDADVGRARVIEEHHHALGLALRQRSQNEAVG